MFRSFEKASKHMDKTASYVRRLSRKNAARLPYWGKEGDRQAFGLSPGTEERNIILSTKHLVQLVQRVHNVIYQIHCYLLDSGACLFKEMSCEEMKTVKLDFKGSYKVYNFPGDVPTTPFMTWVFVTVTPHLAT